MATSTSPFNADRPSLLYVATRWPWPVTSGRQKMIDQTLELASGTHCVTLVSLVGVGCPVSPPPAYVSKAYLVLRPSAVSMLFDSLVHPSLPLQSHLFAPGETGRSIVEIIAREAPDVVMLDMIRMARLAGGVHAVAPDAKIILDMDDRLSERYAQMARSGETNVLGAFGAGMPPFVRRLAAAIPSLVIRTEERLVRKAESSAAESVDCIIFVSGKEAKAFADEPFARDTAVFAVAPLAGAIAPVGRNFEAGRRFVFLGNSDYAPNMESLRLLDRMAMSLRERNREFPVIEAAGAGTDACGLVAVKGRGFVGDIDKFLGSDSIMVAPILVGTGIKTKLLDAMARGVPVVTTPRGADGLSIVNGESAFIMDVSLIEPFMERAAFGGMDADLSRVGLAGAAVARAEHSPQVVAQSLAAAIASPVRPRGVAEKARLTNPRLGRHLAGVANALALICADIVSIVVSFSLAFFVGKLLSTSLTHVTFVSSYKAFFDRAPVAIPIVVASLIWSYSRGHYTERSPFWTEVKDLLSLAVQGVFAEAFIQFAVNEHVSRTWVIASWLLFIPTCILLRSWMKWSLITAGARQVKVALFGAALDSVREAVESDSQLGFEVVCESGCRDAAMAASIVRQSGAHLAIISMGGEADASALDIANRLSHEGIPFALCPPLGGVGLASLRPVVLFGHNSVLLVDKGGLASPLGKTLKRVVDIATSGLMLVLASPVILAATVLVCRDGGSAFYSQIRVGQNGRLIRVWKIRSMAVDADVRLKHLLETDLEARATWERDRKIKDDPRITPVGRVIRKTAIDELPQLWNVLRGDMSLVGPRPVVEEEVARYGDSARSYLGVRPGLSGLWQVSGRSDISYERRVELDEWYVRNWSLWVDTVILCKTVPALLLRRGAY